MTLKQLRIVAAIAKTGKTVGAARTLGVTAPAITLQLKLFEQTLGLALFERSKHGMLLTAAGQQVLAAANRVEAVLLSCQEALDGMRGLEAGSVSIGVVSTAKYFAPAALGAFKEKYPEIEIRLFVANREDTIRSLAALETDLVIMGRPPEGLDVESSVIGDHPHVIIAPPAHRLAARRRIPVVALAPETFLMREQGSGTRTLMQRFFAEAAVSPRVGMEISSNETIKQAVMAGLGIAFISAHTVAMELANGRLVMLDIAGLPARREWQLVRHADKRLMPAAAALWAFLEQDGRRFLPSVDAILPAPPQGSRIARPDHATRKARNPHP